MGKHEPIITKDLFDKCQQIKSIRAVNFKHTKSGEVIKPLMGLLKCGVCDHSVTGEKHTKSSGKVFIYYHCANQKCEERRKNIPQQKIFEQLELAFEPSAHFTPKATAQFVGLWQGRLEELDVLTSQATHRLAEKRLELKKTIEKLEGLKAQGLLSKEEFAEIMEIKNSPLTEIKVEMDAYNEADYKTFQLGLKLIELFTSM